LVPGFKSALSPGAKVTTGAIWNMFSSRTLWMSQYGVGYITQELHLNALAAMRIPALCLHRMHAARPIGW